MKNISKIVTISLAFAIISIMTAFMQQEAFGTLFEDKGPSVSTLDLPQLPDLPIGKDLPLRPDLPLRQDLPQLPQLPHLPNPP